MSKAKFIVNALLSPFARFISRVRWMLKARRLKSRDPFMYK